MFRSQDIVAINISDTSLEALTLDHDARSSRVTSWSRLELPAGIIEDGRLIDKDKAKAALLELLQKGQPAKIQSKEAAVTLPETVVFSQVVPIPQGLKNSDVNELLWNKVSEMIPVDPKDMIVDFYMRETKDGREALLSATYRQLIEDYVHLFSSANIKIRFFSTESLSLARALSKPDNNTPILILDIGSKQTIAIVAANASVRESINIVSAGDQITTALVQSQKISPLEAEKMKAEVGLTSEATAVVIQRSLQTLLVESRMLIQYWQKRSNEKVASIVLTGGTSSMPGLVEYIASNLGLPTQMAILDQQFHIQGQEQVTPKFLPVLGLAILAQVKDGFINFIEPKLRGVGGPTVTRPPKDKSKPAPAKILSMKKTGTQIPLTRLLILGAFFLVALAIFAFVWWQNTPSIDISRYPVDIPTADSNSLEVSAWVPTSATTSSTAPNSDVPVLLGGRQTITTTISFTFDAPFWDSVSQQLTADEDRQSSTARAKVELEYKKRVGDLVMTQQGDQLRTQGVIMIGQPLDLQITSSTPALSSIDFAQKQVVQSSVQLQILVTDIDSLRQLIATPWLTTWHEAVPEGFAVTSSEVLESKGEWNKVLFRFTK